LQLKGQCIVSARVGNESRRNLCLIVVDEENGSNLLGLDWSDLFGFTSSGLSSIDSGGESSNTVSSTRVLKDFPVQPKIEEIANKYAKVLSSDLGRCNKLKSLCT